LSIALTPFRRNLDGLTDETGSGSSDHQSAHHRFPDRRDSGVDGGLMARNA
jgi:hypothetical protein